MLALAGVAFAAGALVGADHGGSASDALAEQFVTSWTRGDYASMYSDIDASSRRRTSAGEFAAAYGDALRTATATAAQAAGKPRSLAGGLVTVPVTVQTHLFGRLSLSFTFKFLEGEGEGLRIAWSPSLAFPGLHTGELLSRRTALPRRATLLARDGSVLAESSAGESAESRPAESSRSSPLGDIASAVLGSVGPVPAARRRALEAQGIDPDAIVGVSGLEEALDNRLRGAPGGQLLAVDARTGAATRVLAYAAPHAAPSVRSTVSPAVQQAAVTALGGQLGGVVAMQPSTGQILAVAGLGLDGLQPPGSTFKMITTSGVLAAKIATPRTVFPYATFATLDGVRLNNANGEECGGTLALAFAVSCNSVFSPLGVKLGARVWWRWPNDSASTTNPESSVRPRARCPPPARSRGNSTWGPRRSGRGRFWPPRWRWRPSPRPSPTAGDDRARRFCRAGPPRARR